MKFGDGFTRFGPNLIFNGESTEQSAFLNSIENRLPIRCPFACQLFNVCGAVTLASVNKRGEDGRMGRQRYRGQEYKRVQNERRLRQAHRCLEYEFVCNHSNPGGLGAIWKNGAMEALRPLHGGHNSQAYWTNNRGQVVGLAESGILDSTCGAATPFQVLRFGAVMWGPNGKIHELRPLQGDTVGFAFGINDNGEAVGTSGLCSNTSLPPVNPMGPHALLWEEDGSPIDLGNLGGTAPNVATSINDRGAVVGASQFTDGTIHPFLWTRATGIQDLGLPAGDFVSLAPCCNTINN
jgi:probable HAF family extracellular repeat protein